jgi:ferredoxin-NADP reductase
VSFTSNKLFAWTLSSPNNPESWQITAFILFFLIFPQSDIKGYVLTAIVAFLAVASKYILVFRGRHIFNPAAVAVVISSALGLLGATWWIATLVLLPVVVIVGVLIAMKLRHFLMIAIYIGTSVTLACVIALIAGGDIGQALSAVLISSPIIFLGTIMLTEPLTSPTTKRAQIVYSLIVGVTGGLQLGWLSKPDVALLIGNIFSFIIGQRRAIRLEFVSSTEIAPSIFTLVFKPLKKVRFSAGQYIELTLPHPHADTRGVRRMFSIASRPGGEYIELGLVKAERSSTFKSALLALKTGAVVRATQVGGSFVLPRSTTQPIVMIAGGIGITPFRSMIDDALARGEKRQILLFYAVRTEDALVYGALLNRARQELALKIIPIVAEPGDTWTGEKGMLNTTVIERYVADVNNQTYYISGPNVMVQAIRGQLRAKGISPARIKTDYFSGY